MKLLWLCHYSLEYLRGKIALDLEGYQVHPAPWIHDLAEAVQEFDDVELHIITVTGFIPVDVLYHSGNMHLYAYSLTTGKGRSGRWGKMLRFQARRIMHQKIRSRIRKISPDVITIHGTEHTFTNAALDQPFPVVLWMQGVMQVIYKDREDKVSRNLIAHERLLFRRIHHFVTAQPHIQRLVRELNPEAQFYPLFYPVSPIAFQTSTEVAKRYDISFSGTLIKRKGVEDFLQALAIIKRSRPDISACFIGPPEDSAYMEHLVKMADSLNVLGNCHFIGRLEDHKDVLKEVASSSLFVYPTHADTAPLSLAEAMAMGKAVIATDVDGIPAMISQGENGILVPVAQPEVLAAEILGLLGDQEMRKRLGEKARQYAMEHFAPAPIASAYLQLCAELCRKPQEI